MRKCDSSVQASSESHQRGSCSTDLVFIGTSLENNSNPVRNDEDLVVSLCDHVRLALLLAAARIANDMVACLRLLIYLCFEVGGAYRGLKE